MGVTIVSDGKKMTQYMPTMNRYTVKDAPADLKDWSDVEAGGMMGASGAYLSANGEEFYKALMDGVTKSEYVGMEEVDRPNAITAASCRRNSIGISGSKPASNRWCERSCPICPSSLPRPAAC